MRSLETKRYILRIPGVEDAEEIYERWGTDKENMAQYKEHSMYKNLIEAKAIISEAIREKEDGVIYWIIENKKNNNIVGYINLPAGVIKDKKREIAFIYVYEKGYIKYSIVTFRFGMLCSGTSCFCSVACHDR